MGYCSEIVIAVRKEILAEDLIHPVIPKSLRDEKYQIIDDILYWHMPSWKWYSSYPAIQEIEAFFDLLGERGPIKEGTDKDVTDTSPWFGAIRMGEGDDDIQTWGDPFEFNISTVRYVNFPGRP